MYGYNTHTGAMLWDRNFDGRNEKLLGTSDSVVWVGSYGNIKAIDIISGNDMI